MISQILAILGAGLAIWQHADANKYRNQYVNLRRKIYEAENRPADQFDAAVLDGLYFELHLLGSSFAAEVGKTDTLHLTGQAST